MKLSFSSIVPVLVLVGCTLPPIRREPQTPIDVIDANDVSDAIEMQDNPSDTVIDAPELDIVTAPDGPPVADGGITLPAMVQTEQLFFKANARPLPFTSSPGASKIVRHPNGLVATGWVFSQAGMLGGQVIYTRGLNRGSAWSQGAAYANVSTPSALALTPIAHTLLVGITCTGDCGSGVVSPEPGVGQSGVVSLNHIANTSSFNFVPPQAVQFDPGPSVGVVSLAVQRAGNELYFSHLTPGTDGVRRILRSQGGAVARNLASLGVVPSIAIAETTASSKLYYGIGGSRANLLDSTGFQHIELDEFTAGDLRSLTLPPAGIVPGSRGAYPIFMAGVESSPNGTVYVLVHGQFGGGQCTKVYRRYPDGRVNEASLGCHDFSSQLQVIDDNQLLFVEAVGGNVGLRIGYSGDQGASWSWRNVQVTPAPGAMLGDLFAAPSLVRPATSPDGFVPRTVRMVFSAGTTLAGTAQYQSLEYVEFSF